MTYVDVKLSSILHVLDKRCRLGLDSNPAERGNALTNGGEVVGLLAAAVGFTKLNDRTNNVGCRLEKGAEDFLRRL